MRLGLKLANMAQSWRETIGSYMVHYSLLVLMGPFGTFYLQYVTIHTDPIKEFQTRSPDGNAVNAVDLGWETARRLPHSAELDLKGPGGRL